MTGKVESKLEGTPKAKENPHPHNFICNDTETKTKTILCTDSGRCECKNLLIYLNLKGYKTLKCQSYNPKVSYRNYQDASRKCAGKELSVNILII